MGICPLARDIENKACLSPFWGYNSCMDFRPRVPSIRALQRELGLGSYDKLHRVISGKIDPHTGEPYRVSVKTAKRIEAATGGAIKWTEFFEDHESSPDNPAAA